MNCVYSSEYAVELPYPEKTVPDLVALWAGLLPDQIAAVQGSQKMTYAELDQRANQLAHYLCEHGVGSGQIIALCLPRSFDFLIALLAILKSGASYLPLDSAAPLAKNQRAIDHAKVSLVLSTFAWSKEFSRALVVDVAAIQPILQQKPRIAPEVQVTLDHVAHIMYTSGTTGQPKGVRLTHRGMVRLACNTNYISVSPSDVIAHCANVAFDASTLEISLALLNGATLNIADEGVSLAADQYTQWLRQQQVSVAFLTTSLFHMMIQRDPSAFASLRAMLFGGEVAHASLVAQAVEANPHCQFVNLYGPTENCVLISYYPVASPVDITRPLPIGLPVAHTSIYILDEALHPVSLGTVGELYCGGDGVALGYLYEPELTREKFFDHATFGRLYKTGDLARINAQGMVEFAGRRDGQVKIRGQRVEISEVEAVLIRAPHVAQAAIAMVERSEYKQLEAYLIPTDDHELRYEEIVQFLATTQLSGAEIPVRWYEVSAFPLTSSGKVSRELLGQQQDARPLLPQDQEQDQWLSQLERLFARCCEYTLDAAAGTLGPHISLREVGLDSLRSAVLSGSLSDALDIRSAKILSWLITGRTIHGFTTKLLQNSNRSEEVLCQCLTSLVAQFEQNVSSSPSASEQEPSFLRRETGSFVLRIVSRQFAPIKAAALGYLPESLSAEQRSAVQQWTQGLPILSHIVETPWGNIGWFILPIESQQLYTHTSERLLPMITQAVNQASSVGAEIVALTGRIPSALAHGEQMASKMNFPIPVTTGHALTISAVVMNLEYALQTSGRELSQETVAFLGLGSIGRGSLDLMLQVLPHPKAILLSDVYANQAYLESLQYDLRSRGYTGKIERCPSSPDGGIAEEVYRQASLIVGATNVVDVLDIDRIQPGTIVVDDSGPHCFSVDQALQRMASQEVLAIEAGEFRVPWEMAEVRHDPQDPVIERLMGEEELVALRRHPDEIMGCLFSGLFAQHFSLPITMGKVSVEMSMAYYGKLREAGITASRLHLTNNDTGLKRLAPSNRSR